jgi:hypothetical protein
MMVITTISDDAGCQAMMYQSERSKRRAAGDGEKARLRTLRPLTLLTLSWGYGCTMRGRVSVKHVQ